MWQFVKIVESIGVYKMFLNFFFGKNVIDNSELAYELFNFDESGKYSNEVKKIMKEFTKKGEKFPDRQDIFLKAIDLIGTPKTPKERFIVAKAYLWSRYPFKLKGIEKGNEYLNNELFKEEYETVVVPLNINSTLENKKNIHIITILHEIGSIYESEYQFENALECYNQEIILVPYFSTGFIDKAKLLVKINKKEEALKLLKSTRESKYYKPFSTKEYEWQTEYIDDGFKTGIEKNIKEIEEKIEKNYKYKSRPSQCKFTQESYNNLSELQKKYLQEYIEKGLVTIK